MSLQSVTITLTISEREGGGGIWIGAHGEYSEIYISGERNKVFADLGPVIQEILSHNHGDKWVKLNQTTIDAMSETGHAKFATVEALMEDLEKDA